MSTIAYVNGPPSIQVYGAPNGQATMTLAGHNSIGQPLTFLIINMATPGWYQVVLPVQPNGTTGWLNAHDVQTTITHDFVRVSLSQFRLWHYVDGVVVESYPVAIGAPSMPTPTGLFYIWGSTPQGAPYTPGIMATSGFTNQPVPGFIGDRVAIHGWTDPSVVGHAVSHGCIRMRSSDINGMLHSLILGTPVQILG